ncbi:MAG: nitroreductase/quinone reductase family protein [Jiangellaceae bacterium]
MIAGSPVLAGRATSGVPVALAPLATRLPGLLRRLTGAHAALFLATKGRLLGRWFGARILVLETVGRRTGQPRATPLVYLRDGPDFVVVPANGGAHSEPAWWLNLRAADDAVAVLGRDRCRVRPREATGPERERLWQRFATVTPVEDYQRRACRRLPIVVLAPYSD